MGDDRAGSNDERRAARPGPSARRERRRRWGRFVLAAVSMAAALGGGELIVRVAGLAPQVKAIRVSDPDNVYRWSTDPILGFELKANYRNDHPNPNNSYPFTNAHGQRDVERAIEKPPGVTRVVLLGDSVVEGHGIMDVQATMSRQLEALYPDGRTEVLNFGVSGYCTRSEIELLETRALAFDPDTVVLVFLENDFRNFNPVAFKLDSAVKRPALVKHLFLRSHLFRLACLNLNLFQFGAEADPARWNRQAIGDNNVVEGLRRFRALAREHHFRPLIAIWPGTVGGRITDGPTMPGGGGLIIERLARMFGIRAFRLSTFLRRAVEGSAGELTARQLYLTGDQVHPSPLGCRVTAQALFTVLSDVNRYAPAPTPADDPAAVEAAAEWSGEQGEGNYAKVHNNEGRRLREEGRLEEALAEFREALAIDPDLPEAHFNMGIVYHRQGRLAEARAEYLKALERAEDNEEAHYNLGLIALDRGDLDAAAAHFRQALVIRPDYADAELNLGTVALRRGGFKEAMDHYRRAIEIQPDHARAFNNMGSAYLERGDHARAIELYRRALAIDPDYFSARHNLAFALEEAGDTEAAIAEYRRALALRPEHAETRAALDRLLGP